MEIAASLSPQFLSPMSNFQPRGIAPLYKRFITCLSKPGLTSLGIQEVPRNSGLVAADQTMQAPIRALVGRPCHDIGSSTCLAIIFMFVNLLYNVRPLLWCLYYNLIIQSSWKSRDTCHAGFRPISMFDVAQRHRVCTQATSPTCQLAMQLISEEHLQARPPIKDADFLHDSFAIRA